MKKFWTLFFCFLITNVYSQQDRLGVVGLNRSEKIESCQSRGLKVRGLQLILRRGRIDLDEVEVEFGSGQRRTFSINLRNVRSPFRSQELMFRTHRCIKSIFVRGYDQSSTRGMRIVVAAVDSISGQPPRPEPTPSPRDFQVGMRVYNLDRNAFADIIGRDYRNGTYTLRFTSGDLSGRTGANWDEEDLAFTQGCEGRFCVGDRSYNIERSAYVRVVGFDQQKRYVLEFTSGDLAGKTGGKWSSSNLASLYGQSEGLRVGDRSFNIERSAYVEIVGIQEDGKFVVEFRTGDLAGKTGAKWSRSNLAKLSGCSGSFCVGDRAYNKKRSADVEIVGIQTDGRFVIKFLTGNLAGKSGGKWSEDSLIKVYR